MSRPPTDTLRGLRPVHWSDIPALAAQEHSIFGDDAWSEATWWAELAERPRREYVVLADDGSFDGDARSFDGDARSFADDAGSLHGHPRPLAGYAGIDHGGEVADVMTVAVAPHARGRGLGRSLLHEIEQRAACGGAAYLMLEVRADNTAARALYNSSGYEVLSVRSGYYQPGGLDALVMRKVLGGNRAH